MEYESNNPMSLQELGLCGCVGCSGGMTGASGLQPVSVIFCVVDDGWKVLYTAE